jgi:DNA-binding NarL/FixJ family response regulator
MSHRILIVEDHALLRHGLRALLTLQAEYRVVGEAVDGREAVLKAMDLQPDLIVMDLSLPGMSGVDATAQIRRRLPQQRVLALSEYDNEIHASEALRAGCAGYVMKHASPDELLLAVRTVLVGRRFISPEMTNLLLNGMLHPGQSARETNRWDSLSERERSIFKLIAEGGTNRSAAMALNLSTKTVEKHRANMMRKLHLSSAVELALLAVDMGLVTRPQSHRPAAPVQTGQAVAPG